MFPCVLGKGNTTRGGTGGERMPPILHISPWLCGSKIKKRSFALDFFFSNKHAEPIQASSLRAFTDWEKLQKHRQLDSILISQWNHLKIFSKCPNAQATWQTPVKPYLRPSWMGHVSLKIPSLKHGHEFETHSFVVFKQLLTVGTKLLSVDFF